MPLAIRVGFGVVAALLVAAGYAKSDPPESRDALPSAIVVAEGAWDLVSTRTDNPSNLSVSYRLRAAYPATGFLSEVRNRLERDGWKPLAEDWVDSRRPSSHEVGWRSHVLRRSIGSGEFFNWSGQWGNRAGDVVVYLLQYESGLPAPGEEGSKPDNDDLRVDVLLKPKRLVSVDALPAPLIVLEGSRDPHAWRDQSQWRGLQYEMAVRYTVTAAYPPSDVMSNLAERLGKQGWVSKAEKLQNLPFLSHEAGWNESKRRLAKEQQFLWESKWRSPAGDSLSYTLSYYSALPAPGAEAVKPDNDELHITASLLTREPVATAQASPSAKR